MLHEPNRIISHNFCWKKANLEMFYNLTFSLLHSTFSEFRILYNKILNDSSISSANKISSSSANSAVSDSSIIRNISAYLVDKYYAELIRCLNYAAECSVPIRSSAIRSAEKHWWSEELDDLKSRSVESHRMWIDAGRPHTGPIFDIFKKEKYSYKLAIRHAKCQATDTISKDLHDTLLNKDNAQFWKIWNSRFNNERESQPVMVDGSVDPVEIAESFAKHFCNVCQPNSALKNSSLRDEFESKILGYHGDELKKDDFFSVELVGQIICELEVGKATGYDNISTEHLLKS